MNVLTKLRLQNSQRKIIPGSKERESLIEEKRRKKQLAYHLLKSHSNTISQPFLFFYHQL